jgi:hypothetical protein
LQQQIVHCLRNLLFVMFEARRHAQLHRKMLRLELKLFLPMSDGGLPSSLSIT